MSYTLADLISEAQNKIGDSSFSTTDLINYANNVNRVIHTSQHLTYMQNTQDYTTNAVALLGSLPTDFLSAYDLRLTDVQYAQRLRHMDFDLFDSKFPRPTLTAPGVPYIWYDFARNIYLFPTPSTPTGLSGYGVELRYRKLPTNLTSTSQTPDVPEEFRQVVLLGMMRQAMERRNRYDVAEYYDQQYQDVLVNLINAYGQGAFQDADPYVIPTWSNGGI